MKKKSYSGLIYLAATFLASATMAQEAAQINSPAPSKPAAPYVPIGERMICQKDIQKYCGTAPYNTNMLKCLYEFQDSLSENCLHMVSNYNPDWQKAPLSKYDAPAKSGSQNPDTSSDSEDSSAIQDKDTFKSDTKFGR